jgi:glycosyltransferase involved in cell wall biosynthesis
MKGIIIDILLSTFNGEKYLSELLDSLINQSYNNFNLIIRDDGSTDDTMLILNRKKNKFRNKLILIEDNLGNIGPSKSFIELIKKSNSNYMMFCDQDDIWYRDKIEISLENITSYPIKNLPLLVFTDLEVVDDNLNHITNSMLKSHNIEPNYLINDFYKMISINPVAGCTMIINKKAKEYILPFPDLKHVFDHWIAVNICIFGKIIFINRPSIKYRQHINNEVGNKVFDYKYFISRVFSLKKTLQSDFTLIKSINFEISVIKYLFVKFILNFKRLLKI